MINIDLILYSWLYAIFPYVNNDTTPYICLIAETGKWHSSARKCVCRAAVCDLLNAPIATFYIHGLSTL